MHFYEEIVGGAHANRHRSAEGHAEIALQPAAAGFRHLWIKADVQIGIGDPLQILHACPEGRHHTYIDAVQGEQFLHLQNVVAAAEAQQGGAQQVHPGPAALVLPRPGVVLAVGGCLLLQQVAHQLVEGFRGPPVLLFAVGRQLQTHHRHGELHALGQGTGLILNQLRGAAFPHQQGIGLEAIHRFTHMPFHQFGGVPAEIPGLKGGVGDGRTLSAPLNHREQQIGIGVPLGGMEHVMNAAHGGGNAHGPHMGWPFVGPERELHGIRRARLGRGCWGGGQVESVAGDATAAKTVPLGRRPGRCRGSG